MAKNLCGKTVKPEVAYEVWEANGWTWKVCKKYKSEEAEKKDPFSRWFCFVSSPQLPGGEYGDVYKKDIVRVAQKTIDRVPKV